MPGKATRERLLAVPEAKKLLEAIGEDKLDQLQRRSLDYALKFSRVDPEKVASLTKSLIDQFELEEEEAIQLVNCMPSSIEEIRVFLAGGRKIVQTSKLEGILNLLDKYRERE